MVSAGTLCGMSEIEILILRLDAPLMSFGGVRVDERNPTEEVPGTSMLAGLCGNALGYDHRNHELLERLQSRIRHASRCDRPARRIVDFQTVDLGQEFMQEGWTTRDVPAGRAGGTAKMGTHIRYRHYLADAAVTVVMTLLPPDEPPTLAEIEAALQVPARPLFIGRKTCLPSTPLAVGRRRASSLREALEEAALEPPATVAATLWNRPRPNSSGYFAAWWPGDEQGPPSEEGRRVPVFDHRDWLNQIHVGRRFVWHGQIAVRETSDD